MEPGDLPAVSSSNPSERRRRTRCRPEVYQKTGILANGSVAETITNNTVIGDASISYIA